jgi:hypothetical protein
MENTIKKITLFLDKRNEGVVQPNGSFASINYSDYFVNIMLEKTFNKYDDYVNIYVDPFKTEINRQLINPYFVEFSFFETIKIIKSGATDFNESVFDKAKNYNITINGSF